MTTESIAASQYTVEGIDPRGRGCFRTPKGIRAFIGFFPGDVVEWLERPSGRSDRPRLVSGGPDRIKADCPFHGPCGGCDWLELREKARIHLKSELFLDAVKKMGSLENVKIHPFMESPESVRYRPRMRLHQSRNREFPDAGFLPSQENADEKKVTGVVPVTSCLLVMKPLVQRLVNLRKAIVDLPFRINGLLLACSADEDKVAGHLILDKGWTAKRALDKIDPLLRLGRLTGLTLGPSESEVEKAVGDVTLRGLVAPGFGEVPFASEPAVFVQGNVFQNPRLVKKVLEFCRPVPGMRIVEGFAGSGNFSIPLGLAGAKVVAVEEHPGSVRLMRRNIKQANLSEKVAVIAGDALKELGNVEPKPDVLLLDPPRTGVSRIEEILRSLQPAKVVYVSCSMESLIKDAAKIIKSGYILREAVGLDLYPRTSHLEGLVVFSR